MDHVWKFFQQLDNLCLGPPAVGALVVGTGIYLTLRLGLLQIFAFQELFA